MNTEIIYLEFKDFHVPFLNLQGIGFNFFAKIMRGSCFFVQVVLVLILQTTFRLLLGHIIKSVN